MLKRREKYDTYLTHVCREPSEKIKYKIELSGNTVAFISCRSRLTKVVSICILHWRNRSDALKSVHGHRPLFLLWTLIYRYPSTPILISPLSSWSIRIIHKLHDAALNHVRTNLKQHINLYFNPDNFPVSTSGNLTWPLPPVLPFTSSATSANTLVSLLQQLMKPQFWLKAPLSFHRNLYTTRMSIEWVR